MGSSCRSTSSSKSSLSLQPLLPALRMMKRGLLAIGLHYVKEVAHNIPPLKFCSFQRGWCQKWSEPRMFLDFAVTYSGPNSEVKSTRYEKKNYGNRVDPPNWPEDGEAVGRAVRLGSIEGCARHCRKCQHLEHIFVIHPVHENGHPHHELCYCLVCFQMIQLLTTKREERAIELPL